MKDLSPVTVIVAFLITVIVNLALLAGAVWLGATIIKAVFG